MVIIESLEEKQNCAEITTKKEVERYKTHMKLECLLKSFFVIEKKTAKLSGRIKTGILRGQCFYNMISQKTAVSSGTRAPVFRSDYKI